MESILAVIYQIIMLFIIAACGLLLRKMRVMTDVVIKGVNGIVLNVAWPAMMIMVTQRSATPELIKDFATVFVSSVIIMPLVVMLIYFTYKKNRREGLKPVMAMLAGMPNAGYMGLPIIQAVYGDAGTLCLAAYIIGFNVVLWSICTMLYTGFSIKNLKGLINPGLISAIIGTALFLTNTTLPTPLLSAVNQLGALNTPLAMLMLGSRIADIKLKDMANVHLWTATAIKLLIMPVIAFIGCKIAGITGMSLGIIVLSSGMPAAAACQMFAEKHNVEVKFAALGVAMTTLLCIVSLPLVMLIIGI